MLTSLKKVYKHHLSRTAVDTVVRKAYSKLFGNEYLREVYYTEMYQMFSRILKPDSNCVDIGCHDGNVLVEILKHSPHGTHHAFEPIPDKHEKLTARFPQVKVMGSALSDKQSTATFHYVRNFDALSGLKRREYPEGAPAVEEITVPTVRLDHALPKDLPIHFIKIDVEGAERQVIEGSLETIARWKPIVVFQHGMGSAEFYGTTPEQVYDLFVSAGVKVSLMSAWLRGKPALDRQEFSRQFYRRLNYVFVGHP